MNQKDKNFVILPLKNYNTEISKLDKIRQELLTTKYYHEETKRTYIVKSCLYSNKELFNIDNQFMPFYHISDDNTTYGNFHYHYIEPPKGILREILLESSLERIKKKCEDGKYEFHTYGKREMWYLKNVNQSKEPKFICFKCIKKEESEAFKFGESIQCVEVTIK